jgi:galactonate dehydratase
MKIGRIETFYAPPRWLFVRVESDDGAIGWGEASLEGWAEAVDGAFEALRDRFIGADPFNIEDIWQVGYRGGFYRGGPVLLSALAGLEQALWDLKGRVVGLPAWQMLGGKVRNKVRSYAWIGGDRPDEIADAAQVRKDQGFSAVKMNATAELDWIGTPKAFDEVVSASRRRRRSAWTSGSTSTAASTGRWPSSWQRRWSRSACCSSKSLCCRRTTRGWRRSRR